MEIIAESFTGAREAAIARYRYMCAKTERQPTEDNTVKEKKRTGRLLYRNPASTLTVEHKITYKSFSVEQASIPPKGGNKASPQSGVLLHTPFDAGKRPGQGHIYGAQEQFAEREGPSAKFLTRRSFQ